jgi:hypothetical protein
MTDPIVWPNEAHIDRSKRGDALEADKAHAVAEAHLLAEQPKAAPVNAAPVNREPGEPGEADPGRKAWYEAHKANPAPTDPTLPQVNVNPKSLNPQVLKMLHTAADPHATKDQVRQAQAFFETESITTGNKNEETKNKGSVEFDGINGGKTRAALKAAFAAEEGHPAPVAGAKPAHTAEVKHQHPKRTKTVGGPQHPVG